MIRSRMARLALLVVVGMTIGCDQVSKHFAAEHLMGVARQSFLGDTLRLEYAENAGAFLSLGSGLPQWARTALFSVGTAIILIGCVAVALRQRWRGLPLLGLALVWAGGISNLVDRVTRGSVIDFLNVGICSIRTGIFNVADMAIMMGVVLLLLHRGQVADESKDAGQPANAAARPTADH